MTGPARLRATTSTSPPALGLILAAFLSAPTGESVAGAWTQERGGSFHKLAFRFQQATHYYEPDGRTIDIPTLTQHTAGLYSEYGITSRLTGILDVPFYRRITLNEQVGASSGFVFFSGDSNSGVGDVEIGARFKLLDRSSTVLSAGLMIGLPIGEDEQKNGLFTGDGELNERVTVAAGHSFTFTPIYINGEIGWNNRTAGYSDEASWAAEVGASFGRRASGILRAREVRSLRNGDDSVVGGAGGLSSNDQSYLVYGPEVTVALKGSLGLVAGVEWVGRGEKTTYAPTFSLGLSWRQ